MVVFIYNVGVLILRWLLHLRWSTIFIKYNIRVSYRLTVNYNYCQPLKLIQLIMSLNWSNVQRLFIFFFGRPFYNHVALPRREYWLTLVAYRFKNNFLLWSLWPTNFASRTYCTRLCHAGCPLKRQYHRDQKDPKTYTISSHYGAWTVPITR